jgi:hypothetical protein
MDATYNLNGGFKPTMKRFADLDGPDFFPTPAWATYALVDNEKFDGDIWESACGNGAMSEVLENTGQSVTSSDLYDRGYGEIGIDFLAPKHRADNIVTNPPYNAAEGFVRSGLAVANRKFALLLRLAFLEGVTFYPAGAEQKGSGTTAYAWFVWDKDAPGTTELKWFKPGYKAKYVRASRDDAGQLRLADKFQISPAAQSLRR